MSGRASTTDVQDPLRNVADLIEMFVVAEHAGCRVAAFMGQRVAAAARQRREAVCGIAPQVACAKRRRHVRVQVNLELLSDGSGNGLWRPIRCQSGRPSVFRGIG
jgi:hypothetical protein